MPHVGLPSNTPEAAHAIQHYEKREVTIYSQKETNDLKYTKFKFAKKIARIEKLRSVSVIYYAVACIWSVFFNSASKYISPKYFISSVVYYKYDLSMMYTDMCKLV